MLHVLSAVTLQRVLMVKSIFFTKIDKSAEGKRALFY